MSRIVRVTALVMLSLALSTSLHARQEMRRSGGGNGLPPYNVAKETKIVGDVTGTESSPMQSGAPFLVVNLTVDGKMMHVLLGPEGWAKEQGLSFAVGAKVEATGVAEGLKFKGDPAMIVRQIKIGTRTIAIRDADGVPAWEK